MFESSKQQAKLPRSCRQYSQKVFNSCFWSTVWMEARSLGMYSFSPFLSSNSSQSDLPADNELFEINDFLAFAEEPLQEEHVMPPAAAAPPAAHENILLEANNNNDQLRNVVSSDCTKDRKKSSTSKENSGSCKVAFKTKSQIEVLDDGYKWRKYGKKMVKNSPNPRNYYRCSSEGCRVKKRVEREREDTRYVITTYQGIHNHQVPSPVARSHQSAQTSHSHNLSI